MPGDIISAGVLSNWRQQVRCALVAEENQSPVFMPMQMLAEPMAAVARTPAAHEQPAPAQTVTEHRRIEIALPDGTCIRVGTDVGLATLRRVIAAVRR